MNASDSEEAVAYAESACEMGECHAAVLYCERALRGLRGWFQKGEYGDWWAENVQPVSGDLIRARLQPTADGENVELTTPSQDEIRALLERTRDVVDRAMTNIQSRSITSER